MAMGIIDYYAATNSSVVVADRGRHTTLPVGMGGGPITTTAKVVWFYTGHFSSACQLHSYLF